MKMKLSALMSEVRGSLNGSVASRNRGGAYLRNKVTPINRNTPNQVDVRGIFGGLSQSWRQLSESERSAWRAIVANYPRTDVFGDTKIPSGFNLFMELNSNLLMSGNPPITSPLMPDGMPSNSGLALGIDITELELTVNASWRGSVDNCVMVVLATPVISNGREFTGRSEYRQVAVTSAPDELLNIYNDYVDIFGTPVENGRIFVRVFLVKNTTGERSTFGEWSIDT